METKRIFFIIFIVGISQLINTSTVEDGVNVEYFFLNFGIDEGFSPCDNNIVYCDQDGYTIRM